MLLFQVSFCCSKDFEVQHQLLAKAEIKFPGGDPTPHPAPPPPPSFSTLFRDFFAWRRAISAIFDDFVALMKATDRRRTVLQTPPLHCLLFSISRLSFLWHLLCKLLETARKTVLSTLLSPLPIELPFKFTTRLFLFFVFVFLCVLFAFSTATLMS